ncbi:leukocidin family pore-forming toxin [Vibrio sp. TRT 17S01]|uniref:leukocidin family pore-forming toxin n=1 Tax=Vibrio sp. TRT 17S01 TaxID=3418505 RepID=UPI003CEF8F73
MKTTLLPLALALITSQAVAEQYVPIVTKGIYITRSGLTCNIQKAYEEDSEKLDFCDGKGSVDIRFNLAQMRSVPSSSGGKVTGNKKYVHFTIDNDQPGAGFHISDNLKQGHSWFQSWANRYDYLGGFARSYQIKISPIAGYKPVMLRNLPHNENREYQHRDTDGFDIGVSGTAGVESGDKGPKGKAEVSASYTYTRSRTLVYDTKDYKIVNRTSGPDFDVSFEFDRNPCNSGTGASGVYGCGWNDALWGNSFVYDKQKINPIAYANFTPNGEALYEAPVEQTGTTVFKLEAAFEPQVLYGKVIPPGLLQAGMANGQRWIPYRFVENVEIDWSHPSFEAQAHVVLQSLDANNTCATASGPTVTAQGCLERNWSQIWGLDTDERYRSRVGPNQCMAVRDDLIVAVESCNQSLNQKWFWEGDKLVSRYQDGSKTKYVMNVPANGEVLTVKAAGEESDSRIQPRLTNISL